MLLTGLLGILLSQISMQIRQTCCSLPILDSQLFQSPLHIGKLSYRGWKMELAIDSHLLDQNKTYEMHFAVWIIKTWIQWPFIKNGCSAGKFQELLRFPDALCWLSSEFLWPRTISQYKTGLLKKKYHGQDSRGLHYWAKQGQSLNLLQGLSVIIRKGLEV